MSFRRERVQFKGIEMTMNKASYGVLLAGLGLFAISAVSDAGWARTRQPADGTHQQRLDCADDARLVCGQYIPDVNRITQCMKANKKKLSPHCRRHFR